MILRWPWLNEKENSSCFNSNFKPPNLCSPFFLHMKTRQHAVKSSFRYWKKEKQTDFFNGGEPKQLTYNMLCNLYFPCYLQRSAEFEWATCTIERFPINFSNFSANSVKNTFQNMADTQKKSPQPTAWFAELQLTTFDNNSAADLNRSCVAKKEITEMYSNDEFIFFIIS